MCRVEAINFELLSSAILTHWKRLEPTDEPLLDEGNVMNGKNDLGRVYTY